MLFFLCHKCVPLIKTVMTKSLSSIVGTDWIPCEEALPEHQHLDMTSLTAFLGTRLVQSIDTWDRLTETKPLTVTVTMTLTESESVTLNRNTDTNSNSKTNSHTISNTYGFPWDKALSEHRHLEQTNKNNTTNSNSHYDPNRSRISNTNRKP